MPSPTIGAIVLAAGRSSRMGRHKLLLPLGDRPVIAHVVDAALSAPLRPLVVVLGHDAEQVRAVLPAGDLTLVDNVQYAEGLASSLRAGLAAMPPEVAGALILLGDQPLVEASHIGEIIRAVTAARATVVAASYAGRRGHPVYFARPCFPELRQVTGDEGGRSVIEHHRAGLVLVPISDADVGLDVDEPTDYQLVCQLWAQRHTV